MPATQAAEPPDAGLDHSALSSRDATAARARLCPRTDAAAQRRTRQASSRSAAVMQATTRAVTLGLAQRISYGELTVHEGGRTHVFGSGGPPSATIEIH